jgi:hypothetical protein
VQAHGVGVHVLRELDEAPQRAEFIRTHSYEIS